MGKSVIQRFKDGEVTLAEARAEAKARLRPRTVVERARAGEFDPAKTRATRDERLAVAAQQRAAKACELAEFDARERVEPEPVPRAHVNEYAAQRDLVQEAQRERRLNEIAANAGKPLPHPDRAEADRVHYLREPDDIAGQRMREHARQFSASKHALAGDLLARIRKD